MIWYAKGRYHYSTTRNVKYFMFFFSLELCGKIASSFFQKGAGHLSSTKCKQQPNPLIRGLGEWMHDAFRELGNKLSIRLPWPLMTRIDPVIQSWTFHKLSVKVGGEKVLFPHLIFNHSNPTICSICTTDINDSWSHHVYTIFTWWTIKRTLKSHNCSLKEPYLQIRILQWLWDDPAPEQNTLATA